MDDSAFERSSESSERVNVPHLRVDALTKSSLESSSLYQAPDSAAQTDTNQRALLWLAALCEAQPALDEPISDLVKITISDDSDGSRHMPRRSSLRPSALAARRESRRSSTSSMASSLSRASSPGTGATGRQRQNIVVRSRRTLLCCDMCAARSMCKYSPNTVVHFRDADPSLLDKLDICDVCGGELSAKAPPGGAHHLEFVCHRCTQTFTRGDRLLAHSHRHTKVKPFHCHDCPKTFSRRSRLEGHRTKFHSHVFVEQPTGGHSAENDEDDFDDEDDE